jgi:hypothetical protein
MAHETQTPVELGEPVFTSDELGRALRLHPSKIRRMFGDEPGVIRIGHDADARRGRYYILRIPRSVVQRVMGRMTVRVSQ